MRWKLDWMLFGLLAFGLTAISLSSATGTVRAAPAPPRASVVLPWDLQSDVSQLPDVPVGISDRAGAALAFSPQGLSLALKAGIKYNRTSATWASIEPHNTTPDQYQWSTSDSAIPPLLKQGIEPVVLVFQSPSWAATTSCGPIRDPNQFGEFFGALVARYPQVKYWELFNEVDGAQYSTRHTSSGGCFGEDDLDGNGKPDYADYAELARVAWSAMHKANPNAQLLIGNLAFDNFTPDSQPQAYPGGCCFNYHFLDHLLGYMKAHPLANGAKYGDLLGFNNYLVYDLAYWERRTSGIGVGSKAMYLRELMKKYDMNFPLAITEMSSWPTFPSPEGIAQMKQARQVVQMYAEVMYYKIKFAIWWTWDDLPDTNCNWDVQCNLFKYGLVDVKLSPKESYFALKTLITQLRGYKPIGVKMNQDYVNFGFKKGKDRKRFVFARTDTLTDKRVDVPFDAKTLRVTDMFGNVTRFTDNGTGKITLSVTANPVYVEINP